MEKNAEKNVFKGKQNNKILSTKMGTEENKGENLYNLAIKKVFLNITKKKTKRIKNIDVSDYIKDQIFLFIKK